MRKKSSKRAGIEPVIGHLKHDCRMVINYLKGSLDDVININHAAAGYNFKGLLRKIKEAIALLFILKRPYLFIYSKYY